MRSHIKDLGSSCLPAGALSVSFAHVWFSYEIKQQKSCTPTLQDISFYLSPGQTLGLLGRTGSGKSTIARLLLRLYDIESGEIRLGDIPIAQTSLSQLRQRVGLVTQDVQLFQASIRDNLTFFDSTISDRQILENIELLGLWEWLQGCDLQLI